MADEFLFVYGTLRKDLVGSKHHLLTDRCEYLSHGRMQGRLYEVNGYPGVIESQLVEDSVCGEIYRISDLTTIFRILDAYEECTEQFPHPHEYVRTRVEVLLSSGDVLQTWVYVYNHNVATLEQIGSGDYLQYVKRDA